MGGTAVGGTGVGVGVGVGLAIDADVGVELVWGGTWDSWALSDHGVGQAPGIAVSPIICGLSPDIEAMPSQAAAVKKSRIAPPLINKDPRFTSLPRLPSPEMPMPDQEPPIGAANG